MTLNPFLALLLPPLLLVPAMGLLSSINVASPLETEIRRKAFHVGIGLLALSFPAFLTSPAIIVVALSLGMGWMLAARSIPLLRRHFGAVLHDAGRLSHGEVYFAVSIATLLIASAGVTVLYVLPLLVLTVSDAVAAIVGRAFPFRPLRGIACGKTASGSIAFFVSAFLVSWPVLWMFTDCAPFHTLVIAMAIASATCVAEAISTRGFDNLSVPVVALFILKLPGIGTW